MTDELFYMSCGYMGNASCFRVLNSTAENDLFSCDVRDAKIFTLAEVVKWTRAKRSAGLKIDKPIPLAVVTANTRPVFVIEHLPEKDRIKLFKFWKETGIQHGTMH